MKDKNDTMHEKEIYRKNKFKSDFENIENIDTIREILNALPSVVLLVDINKQILYCNKNYFGENKKYSAQQIFGLKPGEFLGCINVREGRECGTSNSCRVCGLVNTVNDSQKESAEISRNTKITTQNNKGKYVKMDFRVTASPFRLKDISLTLVTISNISKESRIKSLERIFLHDLYDKVSSLKFLLDTVVSKGIKSTSDEKLKHSKYLSSEIVEEIDAYRAVLAAEKGDLEITNDPAKSYDVIWNAVNNISYHTVAHGKSIEVLEDLKRIDFKSDTKVLDRILTNMLKNALEETPLGGTVKVSCDLEGGNLVFWVHNDQEMSIAAKENIFDNQYSSKGINRGLGTYSMRLLGEEYLGGEVYFTSDKEQGTRFYFALPIITPKT